MSDRRPDPFAEAYGEWIAELADWEAFGGLTYDQCEKRGIGHERPCSCRAKPGADVVRSHVRKWLNASERALMRPLRAVVAVEYQRNGWPHAHPLVASPVAPMADRERELVRQLWDKAHGIARLDQPRQRAEVCTYASKYLSKDLAKGDVLIWPKRWRLAEGNSDGSSDSA